MSKGKRYWYKFMHEWITKPELQRLPDNLWRRYVECFTLASTQNEGGFLPAQRDIAYMLRIDEQTLVQELRQLAGEGLVDWRDYNPFEQRWYVIPYESSQAPTKNAIRQRRWRERQKEEAETPASVSINR